MNPRILLLLLLHVVIPVVRSKAQETPDSKQAELTIRARLKTMTSSDLQTFMAKAKTGDAMESLPLPLPFRVFVWHFKPPDQPIANRAPPLGKTWAQLGRKTSILINELKRAG
jgi:hypothetical protein